MANRNFHGKNVSLTPGLNVLIRGHFAVGATGAVGAQTDGQGVSTIVRNGPGDYTITLADTYQSITYANAQVLKATPADLKAQLTAITTNSARFTFLAVAVATDPANGDAVYFEICAKQSGVAN